MYPKSSNALFDFLRIVVEHSEMDNWRQKRIKSALTEDSSNPFVNNPLRLLTLFDILIRTEEDGQAFCENEGLEVLHQFMEEFEPNPVVDGDQERLVCNLADLVLSKARSGDLRLKKEIEAKADKAHLELLEMLESEEASTKRKKQRAKRRRNRQKRTKAEAKAKCVDENHDNSSSPKTNPKSQKNNNSTSNSQTQSSKLSNETKNPQHSNQNGIVLDSRSSPTKTSKNDCKINMKSNMVSSNSTNSLNEIHKFRNGSISENSLTKNKSSSNLLSMCNKKSPQRELNIDVSIESFTNHVNSLPQNTNEDG